LYSIALLFIVFSGLIHSIWNLFTKKSINKTVFLWFTQWAAIIVFLPFTIKELAMLEHPVPLIGWSLLLISVLLHGVYVLLLGKTYSTGDLSQAYPIMRGTSPLLVPLIGVLILGENLLFVNWIGVASIIIGIFLIGGVGLEHLTKLPSQTALLAFGVGVLITGYTVLDKLVLPYLPPFPLNEATNIGNLLALSYTALRSGAIRQEWKVNWKTIILGGIMAPGGYILFLEALKLMPVAQIAPMREIGIVFGTLMGVFFLREAEGLKRIGASVLIVLGILLLA
jgi:drug/metabolite transporter (DMT)-like permease